MSDNDKPFSYCFAPLLLVYAIVTIVSFITMGVLYSQAPVELGVKESSGQPKSTYQLVSDWDTVPLISVQVVSSDETCPEDHPEEVLYYDFSGL